MRKNRVLQRITVCLLVFCTSINLLSATTTSIHYISTGNSDCILISDNGHYALIDGADNDDEKFLVKYLTDLNIKQLDYLILTHPDADHAGGLDAVVNNFTIKNVFVGNGDTDTKTYKDFLTSCMNKKLQPSVPLADKTFTLGNGSFQFFNQKSKADNNNDNSLVALYTNGSNKFLFMGDSGKEVEEALPLEKIGKVDVLKVGHHGSKSSSSEAFIKGVAPKYGVICVGKDNSYGHPHKAILDTLNKYRVTTYRTDLNGTVIFTSDGKDITVKTAVEEKTPATEKASNTILTTPTPAKIESVVVQKTSQTVYITNTGKKYHRDGCSYLKSSKITIDKDKAEKQGYEPCSKCCK